MRNIEWRSMKQSVPKSVDEYLAAQPEAVRSKLDKVRAAIRRAVPEAPKGAMVLGMNAAILAVVIGTFHLAAPFRGKGVSCNVCGLQLNRR